jgi:mycothiol synthase
MDSIQFRSAQGPDDAAALLTVHARCAAADGDDPHSLLAYRPTVDWYRDELATSDPDDWTIAEADGQIVGYGHTMWDWAERDGTHVLLHLGWVAPAWRRRGIGRELLARLETRLRERAASIRPVRAEYGANAAAHERDAVRLMRRSGYVVGYTVWEMEHDGSERAIPPLPAGYELRPVLPEHHLMIWQSIGDAYDASRAGGRFAERPTDARFRSYFQSPLSEPALWFVAWYGSRIAGQVLCRVREQGGEIFEVSVGVGHRRRGLARALVLHALDALRERAVPRIRLYTMYENPTRAWQLYEAVGFRRVAEFPRWRKPL